jgi:hypothetical protein
MVWGKEPLEFYSGFRVCCLFLRRTCPETMELRSINKLLFDACAGLLYAYETFGALLVARHARMYIGQASDTRHARIQGRATHPPFRAWFLPSSASLANDVSFVG